MVKTTDLYGKSIVIAIFFAMSWLSCASGFKIIDYYEVLQTDDNTYTLLCKLSCENDPNITDVNKIYWSDTLMVVETIDHFYVIKAKKEKLGCCNGDEVIGPLSEKNIHLTLLDMGIELFYLKEKEFGSGSSL